MIWWGGTDFGRDANNVYWMYMGSGRTTTSDHRGSIHVHLSRHSRLLYSAPSPSGSIPHIHLSVLLLIDRYQNTEFKHFIWTCDFPWHYRIKKQLIIVSPNNLIISILNYMQKNVLKRAVHLYSLGFNINVVSFIFLFVRLHGFMFVLSILTRSI